MSEQFNRLVEKGRRQLTAAEAEKKLLYDRNVGGSVVPRPSERFIQQNVGKPKSQAQVDREAVAAVYPKVSQRAADAWVVHNQGGKHTEPQKLRDAWSKTSQQTPSNDSISKAKAAWSKSGEPTRSTPAQTPKEQLRDAWNAKPDPARNKQPQKQRDRSGNER